MNTTFTGGVVLFVCQCRTGEVLTVVISQDAGTDYLD